MANLLFYVFAFLTVACAALVVVNKNPVNGAMFLLLSLVGLAGLFVMLDAALLAFVLILVYAGAVVALFLFIIMLLDTRPEHLKPFKKLTIFASTIGGSLNVTQLREAYGDFMITEDKVHRLRFGEAGGPQTELLCVAGAVPGHPEAKPLAPPPDSWASRPEADVAIWTLRMDPCAQWTLPPAAGAASGTRRCLDVVAGGPVRIAGQQAGGHRALVLEAGAAVALVNDGDTPAEFLLLQGRPIGEPVVQYGPFVMNTEAEVRQAFADYRSTQFGGWPWPAMDPVHGADPGRFARHADGREERRGPAALAAPADTRSRT